MNLIFDFDGTLCDSLKDAVKIANAYLEKEGKVKISLNKVRTGGVLELIQENKIPKYKIAKLLLLGRKKIKKMVPKQKTFRNLSKVITTLSKNHKLGILTTNSRDNVQIFLKRQDLEYFDFIHSEIDIFGKARKLKKVLKIYNLDSKKTAYVGDETRDVKAAKDAKIISLAVTWGFESRSVIKKSAPDYIATKPEDILNIVDTIS